MTREPGNLLPVIVTRKRVGRGAPVSLNSCYIRLGGEVDVAATAVTYRRSPSDYSRVNFNG